MLEAVEGVANILEALARCVLLCTLEVMEGDCCVPELLEVHFVLQVMLGMLKVLEVELEAVKDVRHCAVGAGGDTQVLEVVICAGDVRGLALCATLYVGGR